jgi:hypothetical protein
VRSLLYEAPLEQSLAYARRLQRRRMVATTSLQLRTTFEAISSSDRQFHGGVLRRFDDIWAVA